MTTLAKVSDWNSFRVNRNYSDSFRYLYPSQCESLRTNPKNVLYLVWWKKVKNQSGLIRLIPRHQSKPIRTNPKPSFQSESIRSPINRNRILNQNQYESFRPWIHSDWFGLICIENMVSDLFRLVRFGVSEWIGLNRIDF